MEDFLSRPEQTLIYLLIFFFILFLPTSNIPLERSNPIILSGFNFLYAAKAKSPVPVATKLPWVFSPLNE